MKKYQVMIDDAVSSQSFSLDELLEAGLLDDYDVNIKVRANNETTWQIAREYPFHLSESNTTSSSDYIVNEDGTVTRKKKKNSSGGNSAIPTPLRGYRIDEYGQVVRTGGNTSNSSKLDLSTDSLHFTSSSGSRSITVTTNGAWNISLGAATWVHLSQSGSNLTVRVDQNYSSDSRTDYFKLKSGDKEKRVDIYQSGNSSSSSSSSSPSSSIEDNDGCAWILWMAIGIGILAAIWG